MNYCYYDPPRAREISYGRTCGRGHRETPSSLASYDLEWVVKYQYRFRLGFYFIFFLPALLSNIYKTRLYVIITLVIFLFIDILTRHDQRCGGINKRKHNIIYRGHAVVCWSLRLSRITFIGILPWCFASIYFYSFYRYSL